MAGELTYSATTGQLLYSPSTGQLATCPCSILLSMEDQQCSISPRDVFVKLTGNLCYSLGTGESCSGSTTVLLLYANGDTTVHVDYYSRSGLCVQRLRPMVNGTFRNWDSGATLLLAYEEDDITLTAGDRLQIYLDITGGCVPGPHDDSGGRSSWTITGCQQCQ